MIKEFEFYHGVAFTKLIHACNGNVSIRRYPTEGNASYIMNDNVGIYIKHSSKRLSPWRFSFLKIHQDEILEMRKSLNNVFLLLVCGEDGVVALSSDELTKILDDNLEEIEWISATRNRGEEYAIKGSDGALKHKVSKNDFPGKILQSETKETHELP